MRSDILILLFCLSLGFLCDAYGLQQGDNASETKTSLELPVLWDELQGLTELVLSLRAEAVERRQLLRTLESRLMDREVEAEQLSQQRAELNQQKVEMNQLLSDLRKTLEEQKDQSWEISTLQLRLNASEGAVEDLKKKSTALAAELPFLQTRLRASERTVEQLRRENSVLSVRLCRAETLMDQLRRHVSACNSSSDDSEGQEEQLTTEPEDSVSGLRERQNNSERQLDELQRSRSDMMSRLNICEKSLDKLESNHTDLQVRVNVGEEHLNDLATKQTGGYVELLAVILRLNSTVERLDQLSMQNKDAVVKLESLTKEMVSDKTMTERRSEELGVSLSAVEAAVKKLKENDLEDLKKKQEELEVKVSVGEEHLESLTKKQIGDKAELSAVITKLNHTVEQLDLLNTSHGVAVVKLDFLSEKAEVAQTLAEELRVRLSTAESAVSKVRENSEELKVRVDVAEKHLEDLTTKQTGGKTLLSAMMLRLNDTVKQIGHLFTQNEETTAKLDSLSERAAAAHIQSEELQVRLLATEATVKSLNEKSEELWWRQNATEQQVKMNSEGFQSRDSLISEMQLNITDASVKVSHSHEQLQQQLLTQNSGLEKRLQNSESLLMSRLQLHLSDLNFRLNESEHQLQQLLNHSSGDLKVAFSAALTDSGSVGPFDQETTLIFSKIFSDVGGAYNPTEGVFTAPVRGIYFFSFTAADFLKGYMGLYLYKNNQPIIFNLNLNDHGGYASTSSNMALQLEEGDRVHLSLPASYRLYDDSRNFSIFSGFLLFSL